MERLHLHHPDGTLLATFDLDGLPKRPLTLGTAPSADLRLPGGPDVLGALMRDEDGWLLAAAAPAEGATESRLEPGEPVSLGPYLFRIERAVLEARAALLWRTARGHCLVAPLHEGQNRLAWLPDRSALALNPAIPGERLCDLFLEGEDLTLVTPEAPAARSQRLVFGLGDRFALGPLTALALPAEDADRARATRDPLAWPDRGPRRLLAAAAAIALLLGLAFLALLREAQALRHALAVREPAGIALPPPADTPPYSVNGDAILSYGQLFHACLPGLLATPAPSATGDILARRARTLLETLPEGDPARAPLLRKAVFLENLGTLKRAVAAADWPRLGRALASLDAKTLHYYDGDALLRDARALDTFLNRAYPAACARLCQGGDTPVSVEPGLQTLRDALRDNRFRALPAVADRLDALDRHWSAILAWHRAACGFGGSAAGADDVDACDSKGVLREALYALEDATAALGDPALDAILLEDRQTLAARVAARVAALCGQAPHPAAADAARLRSLARLGRALALPPAQAAARRAEAAAAASLADYERRCRALVADYRLNRLAGDRAAALAALDAILALGPADSPYRAWAQRERARAANQADDGQTEPRAEPRQAAQEEPQP